MERQTTVVRIGGLDYTLASTNSEEYMHRVAIYVDRKMEEIMKNNPKLSTQMAAVLVALNTADELLRLKDSLTDEAPEVPATPAAPGTAAAQAQTRHVQRLQQNPANYK